MVPFPRVRWPIVRRGALGRRRALGTLLART